MDACKRVKQDIVRDHEGALRSLRLLQIDSLEHLERLKRLEPRRWLNVCSIAQIRKYRYAARGVVMICESSRSVAPREISERISRSKETEGSPASILATRDWLD